MKLQPAEFNIKWIGSGLFNEYVHFYPSWAWISETTKGQAKQLSKWTTCREVLTSHLKKDIVGKHNNICIDHTRFALKSVYTKTSPIFRHNSIFSASDKAMETAMKILNVIEKEVGWDLTTITRLERRSFEDANKDNVIINKYIIMGPKEWMRATPLLSLYTLIIRSGWFKVFSKIEQTKDIVPMCNEIINIGSSVNKIRQHIELIGESYEYWLLLVLNEKRLFGRRKPTTIYNENDEYSGITKLITLSPDIDNITRKRWTELVKEYKK